MTRPPRHRGISTRIIELNLLSPLHISQRANAIMQHAARRRVHHHNQLVSGARPCPGTAAYGAAKAGLTHLARSLAIEWAPKVRVNTLTVGLVATEHPA